MCKPQNKTAVNPADGTRTSPISKDHREQGLLPPVGVARSTGTINQVPIDEGRRAPRQRSILPAKYKPLRQGRRINPATLDPTGYCLDLSTTATRGRTLTRGTQEPDPQSEPGPGIGAGHARRLGSGNGRL